MRIWDETARGKCGANREIIYIAGAVGNLISDIIITLLPQRVIWKLQVQTKKKIGIAFIFFVGLLTIIAGGFKADASVRLYESDDKTYQTSSVAVWAIAEVTCALLVFCVPSIPKIFRDSGPFFKLPASFVSWLKSRSERTNFGSGPSLPSFENKRPGPGSQHGSNYSGGLPKHQQDLEKPPKYGPETPKSAVHSMEGSRAEAPRATRVVTTEVDTHAWNDIQTLRR
ncbi:hypothetical protein ANO14919_109450 [Xylariales sp. No.14919]|nr:hypothetical protein ANO14919_109450 [Xylariales sp. No.14919]